MTDQEKQELDVKVLAAVTAGRATLDNIATDLRLRRGDPNLDASLKRLERAGSIKMERPLGSVPHYTPVAG